MLGSKILFCLKKKCIGKAHLQGESQIKELRELLLVSTQVQKPKASQGHSRKLGGSETGEKSAPMWDPSACKQGFSC